RVDGSGENSDGSAVDVFFAINLGVLDTLDDFGQAQILVEDDAGVVDLFGRADVLVTPVGTLGVHGPVFDQEVEVLVILALFCSHFGLADRRSAGRLALGV